MNVKKVYIVGIGGAGTSALATVYKARGFDVNGSDDGDGFYTSELQEKDIVVYDKYDSEHITKNIDLVVHVSAIDESNVELQKARELSLPV
ncbi:MAG: Mur ligase domain-containing protein, partial [Patescibacteria group bacterium]|nr:Mur ligase domain-containing protein [Patescibacteria group bacterium]